MALVLSVAQMRDLDRRAVSELHIPSLVLMENAGRGVADLVARERPRLLGLPVALVCGVGANGGDGFVAARHLTNRGAAARVFVVGDRGRISGDAAVFLSVLEAMDDVAIEPFSAAGLAGAAVIVDALFGTGLRDEVRGAAADAIAAMNQAAALRVAVDVPSGLDADTGRPHGVAVRADLTATMGARKLGLILDPEVPVGRIEVVDIGVPMRETAGLGPYCHWLERDMVVPHLPRRAPAAHKGSSGHLLVVAGSAGKTGAALLAARAALRAGAGLVTVASTAAGQVALDAKVVEAMSWSYTAGDDADAASWAALSAKAAGMKAMAVGPGIPTGPGMAALVRRIAAEMPLPVVLDADALTLLGTDAPSVLAAAPAARVLTPHPGEMARLTGTTTALVQTDRLGSARALAAACRAVVVLKGARTVVAAPDGTAWINPTANPALATAGSGDVLTGVLGALLAQGLDAVRAASAAVFVHGLAGEAAAEKLGGSGVLAGDLPEAVAGVMARTRS